MGVQNVAPFNLVGFLKSPMGMLAAFMLFALVVMPMLKVIPQLPLKGDCLPLAVCIPYQRGRIAALSLSHAWLTTLRLSVSAHYGFE